MVGRGRGCEAGPLHALVSHRQPRPGGGLVSLIEALPYTLIRLTDDLHEAPELTQQHLALPLEQSKPVSRLHESVPQVQ